MDSDSSDKPDSPINRPSTIDIQIQFGTPPNVENELVSNVTEPHLVCNCVSEVLLAPLINYLKTLGYPLDNAMIWYYSPTARLNVYCGNDPLPFSISIPMFEIKDNKLSLICRGAIRNKFGTVVTLGSTPSAKSKPDEEASNDQKSSRRTKERKIGYIIEKVSKWRKLYNGTPNTKGELQKMTLEEAATKVGISKKSLDDYLLQLRFGRKFGFNFQEHKDDKVGILRAYVKKCKTLHTYAKKIEDGEPIPADIISKLQEPGTPACKHNRCCAPSYSLPYKHSDSQPSLPLIYPSYPSF
ncbi:unnamed protein product [Blepharisma stoltei]|uniref:Uncharacterized protein n=1 Tax=Blepharisma stoltei TaxID=1481888 RepID=A0AAU9ISD7_9CILI|nr:unnamed protein product [Blepharisma stoltei]